MAMNGEEPIDLTDYYGYLGNGKELFTELLITVRLRERSESGWELENIKST